MEDGDLTDSGSGLRRRGRRRPQKLALPPLHTRMSWTTFANWITNKCLVEVTELFDRAGYNALFNAEIDKLLAKADDPSVRRELEEAKRMDWVGYISSSLRRSGVPDADLDVFTSELIFKLLVEPGGLFKRWNGAPILARFKTSVKNGVINLALKRRTRRRRFSSGGAIPEEIVAREIHSDQAVEAFRRFVSERLGELGLAILDLRLSGNGETKQLVGASQYGKPSSYRVKETVRDIKRLAADFARMTGDEELLVKIATAMRKEQETVKKRFGLAPAVA